ncbi:MAG: urease accessory protein UreE [Pedosphaera sp.]|nr:urease accessory protein UreE [Pedosphaera sp.]
MFTLFRNSAELEVIRGPLDAPKSGLPMIELPADRFILAKRRWRGRASDGREFGFELDRPLRHGDIFLQTGVHSYVVAQAMEPVLRVVLTDPPQAARVAWQVGNMHLSVEVRGDSLFVEDNPILRNLLDREGISFTAVSAVFEPLGGMAGHRH